MSGAHVLLPAQAWGEKSGTVTNSERRISRQRAFLAAPGEGEAGLVDRQRGCQSGSALAPPSISTRRRMCSASTPALSAFENGGGRDFDIGALTSLSDEAFDAMAPVQWPARDGDTGLQQRFFAEGGFLSNDRKARFVATDIPALRT